MIDKILDKTINGLGDSDGHLLTLFSIAVSSKAKTIVELGVRNGDTTLPLFEAAKLNNGMLYSVDINSVNFVYDYNYWKFIKMDAIEFLSTWDNSVNIDFIYIDDFHSYDHVKKELEILDTIVSPSSIILIHDLMYGNTCPFYHTDITLKDGQWANGGPYRAVAELDPQFWEFSTLPWCNGLTILRKKYSSKYKNK
jgi:predicted O-methyltransferase YrrM